jgi:hypothetical protein
MIMLKLGAHKQVTDDACIFGNFNTHGMIDCPHRGQGMGVRSDAARALYKMVGIPGIPALQNELDAPKHLARAPGIHHLAAGHLDFNPEMTLNSGYGVYRYSLCHMGPPFYFLNRKTLTTVPRKMA